MVMLTSLYQSSMHTPKTLYKHLLRECQKLPKGPREFYKHSTKQSFRQYTDESDSSTIKQLIDKAINDAEWIIKKYQDTEANKPQIKRT